MTKIMLVEDDNNLREIYEARLLAEGYEIVSAKDGEEALALAVKEKPDLIISDVMMPKISGFDMLDILRSTQETKNTKVIMMTALSQSEDKARADKLGADRYLVKSQVTLEDVAKVAREVLSGEEAAGAAGAASSPVPPTDSATPAADPAASATAATDPVVTSDPLPTTEDAATDVAATAALPVPTEPVAPAPAPSVDPATTAAPSADEAAAVDEQIKEFVDSTPSNEPPTQVESEATPAPEPTEAADSDAGNLGTTPPTEEIAVKVAPAVGEPSPSADASPENTLVDTPSDTANNATDDGEHVPIAHKKIIEPLNDPTAAKPDLDSLLAKEEEKGSLAAGSPPANPPADSVVQPGGATVTPPATGQAPDAGAPGNTIHPTGDDPGNVAL
ncbi:MAG TPA: response regulator [Patescibacteria group bacterium]|nr:response regulator [Patescibacteria group bacterium]